MLASCAIALHESVAGLVSRAEARFAALLHRRRVLYWRCAGPSGSNSALAIVVAVAVGDQQDSVLVTVGSNPVTAISPLSLI